MNRMLEVPHFNTSPEKNLDNCTYDLLWHDDIKQLAEVV